MAQIYWLSSLDLVIGCAGSHGTAGAVTAQGGEGFAQLASSYLPLSELTIPQVIPSVSLLSASGAIVPWLWVMPGPCAHFISQTSGREARSLHPICSVPPGKGASFTQ